MSGSNPLTASTLVKSNGAWAFQEWVAGKAEGFWQPEKHEATMRDLKKKKEKVGGH